MEEAESFLLRLTGEEQRRLLNAMQTIEDILDDDSKPPTSYLFRLNSPGDIGWIIHRHGVVYSEEYGFDETFEALVAEILVQFIRKHDPKRECIWIAEQDGERVGSVMIVDAGEQIAQLRLLLVEPRARGRGIGKQLINECIKFSRRNRYRKIKLWTQGNLLEARHLYAKAGFKMVGEYPPKSFGLNLIAEFWELPLQD
ncbi:MAG: GNAT family N-acetyltransferase [Desulfobacterales bacterium]|jgi:GNAT superfamily N-acetyltransferase|nr:GNAT family N-acetyltransferase [Desulfobacterales bacterium]MDP6682659.1 GNAT family N-acetyltransferase [Desulfobacterales bacterium]MDP6808330.1 GNAT family N-acetyltransferase [Desulfobacterales bacterium]|tara:strand:+ start:40322 stop:40918 length:597 start_codon:yes stop_codon:yes gene_type:complete